MEFDRLRKGEGRVSAADIAAAYSGNRRYSSPSIRQAAYCHVFTLKDRQTGIAFKNIEDFGLCQNIAKMNKNK